MATASSNCNVADSHKVDNSLIIPTPRHNEPARRFELSINGLLCRCDYRLAGNMMQLVHTEVAPPLQGHGVAGVLVRAALDHARARGLKVQPLCSYVHAYMRRNPETLELLA